MYKRAGGSGYICIREPEDLDIYVYKSLMIWIYMYKRAGGSGYICIREPEDLDIYV